MQDYKSVKEAFVADNPGTSIWTVNAVSLVGLTSYTVAASLATFRTRTDFPSDYLTSLLPLLLGQTLFSHHPLKFNAALLAISVLLAYASPRGPLKSSPTLGEQQSTSRQPDGSARPAHVEADSSSDDDAPIAAKAVPLPPKADTTLRRRKEVLAANTADRKPSPSPLLDLPTESERKSPFDGLPQRSPPHSRSISPDTRDHAIDIAASPTAAQGFFQPGPRYPTRTSTFSDDQRVKFPQQPFLSVYRAHMMIMTVVAILAVDFPIFPREFGKCEDWGTSLMDIGVGSFVFSQGIISALPLLRTINATDSQRLGSHLLTSLRKCAPVLALGILRVLMVKGAEYPEHVTEYGVHWNFFFTLGLMPFFGALAVKLRRFMPYTIMALLLSSCHLAILEFLGVQRWVMSSTRVGLIGMNKEGIVSFPGYFAIFLLGLDLGHYVLPPDPDFAQRASTHREKVHPTMRRRLDKLVMVLISYSAVWWALLWVAKIIGLQVSRRLANLPYVLWTAAFNTSFLLGYMCVEMAFATANIEETASPLLEAYNKNGLVLFLAANVGTGLVNLSMRTMYASNSTAMMVLLLYTAALSWLAWTLRNRRLRF